MAGFREIEIIKKNKRLKTTSVVDDWCFVF